MCGLPNVEPTGRVREALYAGIGFATETKQTQTADCHEGSKMNHMVFLFKTQRKFGSTDCPTLLLVNRLVTNDDCTLCVSCHRQFSMCVQLDVQRRVDK